MDTNKLLRNAGITEHPTAYRKAYELARDGYTEEEILSIIRETYDIREKIKNNESPLEYSLFGEVGVDIPQNAIDQMNEVMRLPPAVAGALMPDAHQGYAMPIGGVVGMINAVSPSFVGYDIACRMTVSLPLISVEEFMEKKLALFDDMQAVSRFGLGAKFDKPHDHGILYDTIWTELHMKDLQELAREQLGTSGGGNHFFDALVGTVVEEVGWLPYKKGTQFVALMTHSGSRGVGHKLATYYQKLAWEQTNKSFSGIPRGYEFLRMDSEAGQEYWRVMQLMGRYAQANHHIIHDSFYSRTGLTSLTRYENHHNFAWLEDGLVVHRKGATPAGKGQIGIIPGSSGTDSFLVAGLGNPESLNSSSHGAGRPFSRKEAKRRFNEDEFIEEWTESGRLYSNVAEDETYQAYKDIERVISIQDGTLVRVIARMSPEIVIMGGKSDDGD